MKESFLINNEIFSLKEKLDADTEASLISRCSKMTLEEKISNLKRIKENCSASVKEKIQKFISTKERTIAYFKDMLKLDFYLVPEEAYKNCFLIPEVFDDLDRCINDGNNQRYRLVKLGESNLGLIGYGYIKKDRFGGLIDIHLFWNKVSKYEEHCDSIVLDSPIKLQSNLKKLDIIQMPFDGQYYIVLEESDLNDKKIEKNHENECVYEVSIPYCRPAFKWDSLDPYYFGTLRFIDSSLERIRKVSYEDAPDYVKALYNELIMVTL